MNTIVYSPERYKQFSAFPESRIVRVATFAYTYTCIHMHTQAYTCIQSTDKGNRTMCHNCSNCLALSSEQGVDKPAPDISRVKIVNGIVPGAHAGRYVAEPTKGRERGRKEGRKEGRTKRENSDEENTAWAKAAWKPCSPQSPHACFPGVEVATPAAAHASTPNGRTQSPPQQCNFIFTKAHTMSQPSDHGDKPTPSRYCTILS